MKKKMNRYKKMFLISLSVGIILLGFRYMLFYGFGVSLQTMFGETCDYTPMGLGLDYSQVITGDSYICESEECYVRGEIVVGKPVTDSTRRVFVRKGNIGDTLGPEINHLTPLYFDANKDGILEGYDCWECPSGGCGPGNCGPYPQNTGNSFNPGWFFAVGDPYNTVLIPSEMWITSNISNAKLCPAGGGGATYDCKARGDSISSVPTRNCDGITEHCTTDTIYYAKFNLCPPLDKSQAFCSDKTYESILRGSLTKTYTSDEILLTRGDKVTFLPEYTTGGLLTNKKLFIKNCAAYKNLAEVLPGTNYTVGNPIGNVPVRLNSFALGGGVANQPVTGVLLKNGVEILGSGAKAPTTMTGPNGDAVLNFGYIPTTTETLTVKAIFGDAYDPLKSIIVEAPFSVLNSLKIIIDCPTDITANREVTCSYLITDANGVTLTLAPKKILINGQSNYQSSGLNSFSFTPTSTAPLTISITAEKSGFISKTETITRTVGVSQVGEIGLKESYAVGEPIGEVSVFSGTPNQKVYIRLLRSGQAITSTQSSTTNNVGEAIFNINYIPQTIEQLTIEATIGEIGASSTIVVSKQISIQKDLVIDISCPVSAAKGMEVECLYEVSDGVTGGVVSISPTITIQQGARTINYQTLVGQTGFKFIPNYAGEVIVKLVASSTGYLSETQTASISIVEQPLAELTLTGPYTINKPIGEVKVKLLQYSEGVAGQDVRIEVLKNNVPIQSYIPISTNNIGEVTVNIDYIPTTVETLTIKATIGDVAANNYVVKTQEISVLNSLIIKMSCGGLTATVNRPVTCTWKVTDGATGAIISVKPVISISQGNKIITYQTLAGDAGITFTPTTMGEVNIKMTASKTGYVTGEDNYALPVQGLTTSFYFYIDNKDSASYAGSGITTGTHQLKFVIKESEINKDISSISGTIRTPSGQDVDITFSKKAVGEYEATYNFMQAGQTYDFSGLILPISLADEAIPFTYKITTISALTEQDKSDTTLIIIGIAGGVVVFLVILVLLLKKKKRR